MQVKIKQIEGLQVIIDTPISVGSEYRQNFVIGNYFWNNVVTIYEGNDYQTGLILDKTPFEGSTIQLQVNGLLENGSETIVDRYTGSISFSYNFYFSNDGGITKKNEFNLEAGDELYWNALNIGYQLGFGDVISIIYNKEYVNTLPTLNKSKVLEAVRTGYVISTDCFGGTTQLRPYTAVVTGGSLVGTVLSSDILNKYHPGVVTLRSGGSVNTGYGIALDSSWSSFVFMDGLQMDCVFKLPTDTLDNVIRIGFTYGSNSVTEPTFGNYFVINGNLLVGKTNNNSVVTQTSSFTLTSNIWYQTRVKESVDVDGTSRVTFTVYDIDGLELYNQSSTTNISFTNTRTTQVLGIHTITGLSKTIAAFDYLGTTLPQMVRGSLN